MKNAKIVLLIVFVFLVIGSSIAMISSVILK